MSEDKVDDDLDFLNQEKIQSKDKLDSTIEHIENGLKNFKEETQSDLNSFANHKSEIKSDIKKWKQSIGTTISSLNKTSLENFRNSSNIASSFLAYSRSIIIAFSLLFVGLFFVFFYENSETGLITIENYNLDQNALMLLTAVAVLDIVLVLLIRHGANFLRQTINQTSLDIKDNLDTINDSKPDVNDDLFDKLFPFPNIQNKISHFDDLLKSFTGDSKKFIPLLEKFYSVVTRRHLQGQFRRSMKNALGMYGLYDNPPEELEKAIGRLSSPEDDEESWLDNASKKVSTALMMYVKLPLDPQIIKFIYCDYVNHNYLSNEWNDINNDNVLLKQLAHILSSRILKIDVSGSDGVFVDLIKKSEPFRLKSFEKDYYDFFVDFEKKKSALRVVISLLKFNPDEMEKRIKTFFPSTKNKESWDEEFAKNICDGIDFSPEYLLLFYYDRLGLSNGREQNWKKIQDPDMFADFVQKFYERKLIAIPEKYQNEKSITVLSSLAKKLPSFDFHAFNQLARQQFKSIDEHKDRLKRIIEYLDQTYITNTFLDSFEEYVPVSDDTLDDLVTFSSRQLPDVSYDILWLFYGEKYDQIKCREVYDDIVRVKPDELSEFLLNHKKIHINNYKSVENLTSVLKHVPKFDLIAIQSLYEQYSGFTDLARKMHEYYSDQKIVSTSALGFSELISVIKNSDERLVRIMTISEKLVSTNHTFTKYQKSVSNACCTLFLFSQSDFDSRQMCNIAKGDLHACDILYHNMEQKDEQSFMMEKHSLAKIIVESLPPNEIDRDYLFIFKEGLSNGILYYSKTEMMQKQKATVDIEIEKLSEINQELVDIKSSLRSVLDEEIENDNTLLQYAIESQIIQAYVITKKGQSPSLPLLQDTQKLEVAAEKINLGIPIKEFLILGDDKKTPGYGTRLGIVPLNMSFEEFSKKFHELYETAIDQLPKHDDKTKFSLNLVRIMTSPSTFWPIRFAESEDEGLVPMIEKLLRKDFTEFDKLQLVATFQNDTGKSGVRGLLEKALNRNLFYSYIHNELPSKVVSSKQIEDVMMSNSFPEKLYRNYNVSSFTQLCVQIHNSRETTSDEQLKNVLNSHITHLLQSQDPTITDGNCMEVTSLLYAKLTKIGRVLSV